MNSLTELGIIGILTYILNVLIKIAVGIDAITQSSADEMAVAMLMLLIFALTGNLINSLKLLIGSTNH